MISKFQSKIAQKIVILQGTFTLKTKRKIAINARYSRSEFRNKAKST